MPNASENRPDVMGCHPQRQHPPRRRHFGERIPSQPAHQRSECPIESHRAQTGMTSLHFAAGRANLEILQKLVQYKADVNKPDNVSGDFRTQFFQNGRTALHMACSNGHAIAVQFLLQQQGINVNSLSVVRAWTVTRGVGCGDSFDEGHTFRKS